MALKILYSPDDYRILGAQCIGKSGAKKRIDVISTVISLQGKITDLLALELYYAPPYSSAKDPVNVLGYIAENLIDGYYGMVDVKDIDEKIEKGGFLLDVRTPVEFFVGKIKGAYNIPVDELRERIGGILEHKDKDIYVTCQVSLRAHIAIMILKNFGFKNLYNLSGGYLSYKNYKYVLMKHVDNGEDGLDIDQQILINKAREQEERELIKVDARGLQCSGPLMATYKAVEKAEVGDKIEVTATDYDFTKDSVEWCKANYHNLLSIKEEAGGYVVLLQKGGKKSPTGVGASQDNATIVVFSGELVSCLFPL